MGVLKKLSVMYPNLDFDIFVGTSAGSLVVTLASLGEVDVLEHVYTTTKTADILKTFNIVEGSHSQSQFEIPNFGP